MSGVDKLADAKTLGELVAAHREIQQEVRSKRRKGKSALGPLAQSFTIAIQTWDEMKAGGSSPTECLSALEKWLRASWPFSREWKYLCQNCEDTGLTHENCPGDRTCGREKPHGGHTFGTPCWCSLGRRFKEKQAMPEDFTQAGKMTRVGRR